MRQTWSAYVKDNRHNNENQVHFLHAVNKLHLRTAQPNSCIIKTTIYAQVYTRFLPKWQQITKSRSSMYLHGQCLSESKCELEIMLLGLT